MKLPSNELLSVVLHKDITYVYGLTSNIILYNIKYLPEPYEINIYELAYLCKAWSFLHWYDIESSVEMESCGDDDYKFIGFAYLGDMKNKEQVLDKREYKEFIAPSEPEAIFAACEWILNEV